MKLKRESWPVAAAALLGILLFLPSLRGTYVYDDVYIAQLDPRLHHLDRWDEFLTKAYFPGAPDRLFRPLSNYSFAIEWLLHGDRAWMMHLVNVLLYGGVCALVAALARRVGGVRVAWVAGLLFAAHPVHVEAVSYLVGRADLFSTLGILGAILLFLRRPMRPARAAAIWGCMVGAILTKEPGMLVPVLLLAWVPFRRVRGCPSPELVTPGEGLAEGSAQIPYADTQTPMPPDIEKRGNQALIILLCWTLAAYIAFREQSRIFKFSWDPVFLDITMNPLVLSSPLDRVLIPFSLVGRYLQILVVPWRLSIDYSGWIGSKFNPADPYFYLGVAAVVGWWVGLVVAVRRRAFAVVGAMLCLVLAYAMVSNLGIVIGAVFGERLIFLPSVFFVLLLAMAAARLPTKVLAPAMVAVLVLAAVRLETYAWRWHDALRLYSMCAEEQPKSARLRMLEMDRLRDKGDYEGAARAAAEGCAAQPDYWRIWYYAALVAAERGRFDEAARLMKIGMAIPNTDPGSFGALRAKIEEGEFGPPPGSSTRPATTRSTSQ